MDKSAKPHDFVIREIHERIQSSNKELRRKLKLIQRDLLDDNESSDNKDNSDSL